MSQLRTYPLAFALLALTLFYNVVEGVIAIASGLRAGSLVLLSFGADSYLEVLAAAAVIWRLSYRDEEAGQRAEGRALRFIGITFLALAAASSSRPPMHSPRARARQSRAWGSHF